MAKKKRDRISFGFDYLSWRQTADERQDATETGRNKLGILKQFQKRRKHLDRHHCRAVTYTLLRSR